MERTKGGVELFERLEVRRANLQINFALLYVGLALLFSLTAAWVGLSFATQLSRPIGTLISATEQVRAGDLKVRVPEGPEGDEIAFLSRAFNRLPNDLATHQQDFLAPNPQLARRPRLTATAAAGVSSG